MRTYYTDAQIQKAVLDKEPVPSKMDKTMKLDSIMESYLREKNTPGKIASKKDKSLARISSKIRDIMGPLAKIWQQVEDVRGSKEDLELDLDDVAKSLHHTVNLIARQ